MKPIKRCETHKSRKTLVSGSTKSRYPGTGISSQSHVLWGFTPFYSFYSFYYLFKVSTPLQVLYFRDRCCLKGGAR